MAAAKPIIEVAGGAQGHDMGRVVTGVVLRRNVWVGEAGPGRTLVAPSSCGKPAFGAWKRPGVCQREVFRDKLVPSSRVIDPVPSCFMLSPRLKHCGRVARSARAGSVAHGRGAGNNRDQDTATENAPAHEAVGSGSMDAVPNIRLEPFLCVPREA